MAYITVAQFLRLYDARVVSQRLSDTGTPVSPADLPTDPALDDILEIASEQVAAAALAGRRYTPAQLTALAAGDSAGFLLRRLVADLAWVHVVARRGQGAADLDRLAPQRRWAEGQLELLRLGTHIFPGVEGDGHPAAGLPDAADLRGTSNANRIDTLTTKARRMFPVSCDRIPNPRNGGCC